MKTVGFVVAAAMALGVVACAEETNPMFYKAQRPDTGNMWDTWLWLDHGAYHLYYLANAGDRWDNISMAISPDGVHWDEVGPILSKRPDVTWMGTGSVWRSPQADGKYYMNFSEWKGTRQTILFAESADLLHWARLGNEYEFVQDERWYEPNGRWDCIWTVPRPGGGLYGYWTANPKAETGGRFGFGETLDGITWKALPPPKVEGVGEGEVGAVTPMAGRYYMMFGTQGSMTTLVADAPEGPFQAAKKNARLLSGHTYFSRFFPVPDGVLVNHHAIARDGKVSFGLLKQAVVDSEGTLRLAWWKGNEALKRIPVEVVPPKGDAKVTMLESVFDAACGIVVEGRVTLPAGLYIDCGESGSGILLSATGTAQLGSMKPDGSDFAVEKQVDRDMDFGKEPSFRLLLKGSLLEFYLNDILIECFSLPANATGHIGLVGAGSFQNLKAWN